jgi:hypothetical protein
MFEGLPLAFLGGGQYLATLPPANCGESLEFYVAAEGTLSGVITRPIGAPAVTYDAAVATVTTLLDDCFETDLGWSVQSVDMLTGFWGRAVPAGNGDRGDPTADFDGTGCCYLTDNRVGNFDVDGGPTVLTSPAMDVTGVLDPVLSYARWFANDDHDADRLTVELSNDDGATWVLLEDVPDTSGWVERQYHLDDYLPLTDRMRVRFSAVDNPNNSLTEAAIDAFMVRDLTCVDLGNGDFDVDGDVDLLDFARFQTCFGKPAAGECLPAQMAGVITIDLADFAVFTGNLEAGGPQ